MAKQIQLILDDEVIVKFKEKCRTQGKSVQKVLEAWIKEQVNVSHNAGTNGVGKGEDERGPSPIPLLGSLIG